MRITLYDLGARFLQINFQIKRIIVHSVCTFWFRSLSFIAGIDLGRNVSFNGRIILDRFKYSKISIGDNCVFNSSNLFNPRGINHCILQTATDYAKIEIGNNCGFSGVSIVANNRVTIGNNVTVGADTCIGDRDDHPEILGTKDAPVEIKDNVFIGMHCLILKGVTIGENSIIGAGSVVTKDIPANCVAAGVPCKVIRYLDK